jgi:hypothetical protein
MLKLASWGSDATPANSHGSDAPFYSLRPGLGKHGRDNALLRVSCGDARPLRRDRRATGTHMYGAGPRPRTTKFKSLGGFLHRAVLCKLVIIAVLRASPF